MKKFFRNTTVALGMAFVLCSAASCGIEFTDNGVVIDKEALKEQANSLASSLDDGMDAIDEAAKVAADGITSVIGNAQDAKEGIDAVGDAVNDAKEGLDYIGGVAKEAKDSIDAADGALQDIKDGIDTAMKLTGQDSKDSSETESVNDSGASSGSSNEALLSSAADLQLTSVDGGTKNYTFVYGDETFSAIHTTDHWKIVDSYKINNGSDMRIICQALIDLFPVHGSDMKSYRTAEDMTYEWQQHNLAYMFIGDESEWSSHLKDVDFDPYDQGKSIDEIYEDRTGKEFNIRDFLSS